MFATGIKFYIRIYELFEYLNTRRQPYQVYNSYFFLLVHQPYSFSDAAVSARLNLSITISASECLFIAFAIASFPLIAITDLFSSISFIQLAALLAEKLGIIQPALSSTNSGMPPAPAKQIEGMAR